MLIHTSAMLTGEKWNKTVGGDAAEVGSGPGSYDIRQSVWHVNVSVLFSSVIIASALPNISPSVAMPKLVEVEGGESLTVYLAGKILRLMDPSSLTTCIGLQLSLVSLP